MAGPGPGPTLVAFDELRAVVSGRALVAARALQTGAKRLQTLNIRISLFLESESDGTPCRLLCRSRRAHPSGNPMRSGVIAYKVFPAKKREKESLSEREVNAQLRGRRRLSSHVCRCRRDLLLGPSGPSGP